METRMTFLYSFLHLLVDGICAFAMFGKFLPLGNQAVDFLLYNFCAFALQMPFGAILDLAEKQEKCPHTTKIPYFVAISGVLFTFLGTITHPVVLGIGNALFHVGGGVGTIHEDYTKHWQGKGLGIFVAPGALGLYLGTLAAKMELHNTGFGSLILSYCSAVLLQHAFYNHFLIDRTPAAISIKISIRHTALAKTLLRFVWHSAVCWLLSCVPILV